APPGTHGAGRGARRPVAVSARPDPLPAPQVHPSWTLAVVRPSGSRRRLAEKVPCRPTDREGAPDGPATRVTCRDQDPVADRVVLQATRCARSSAVRVRCDRTARVGGPARGRTVPARRPPGARRPV